MEINTPQEQGTDQTTKKDVSPENKIEEVKIEDPVKINILPIHKRKKPSKKRMKLNDGTSAEMSDDEDENISEKELEDRMIRLNLGLNEICSTPILLMGVFDVLFENIPQAVKIQFKDVGIKIETYFLDGVDSGHTDLIKYLINKIK